MHESVNMAMARKPGEWMQPADDRILEHVRDEGNVTPGYISNLTGISKGYAQERCRVLTEYGLLTRLTHGLYTISDDGVAYLDEQLDADDLAPDD